MFGSQWLSGSIGPLKFECLWVRKGSVLPPRELLIGVKHYFPEINSSRHVLPYVSQSEVRKSPQVTDIDSMRIVEDKLDVDIGMIATAADGPVVFPMS